MTRTRIGVLFGGRSEEHPISLKSAREVAAHLDLEKYEPFYVGITSEGAWRLCDGPDDGWESGSSRPAVLSPDPVTRGLLVLRDDGYETVELDVVLPVLHGKFGEDGAIQGLLELSGIPYVGCGIQSSAVCMDKSLAYVLARAAGIATPDFWVLARGDDIDPRVIRYPVFVKPARSGSSFGVSRVTGPQEFGAAVAEARRYDEKVLVEAAVVGSEVGCAVMGSGRELTVGEVDRIALSGGFFRIHQESTPETGSENSTPIVPADIPDSSRRLVQATAEAIYRVLGCTGIARVDMFLTEEGTVILNEVNTMPGMTSYSRYPRMMAAAGIPLSELLDRLATEAMAGSRR